MNGVSKTHFKLFKAGKLWLVAGITTAGAAITLGTGPYSIVHADASAETITGVVETSGQSTASGLTNSTNPTVETATSTNVLSDQGPEDESTKASSADPSSSSADKPIIQSQNAKTNNDATQTTATEATVPSSLDETDTQTPAAKTEESPNALSTTSVAAEPKPTVSSTEESAISSEEMSKIKHNQIEYLIGNETINNDPVNKAKMESIAKKGKANIPDFDHAGNAVYEKLVLDNSKGTDKTVADLSANLGSTYTNLYSVALAYATPSKYNTMYKNQEAKNALIDALKWLQDKYLKDTDKGYYGNWYQWEIGVPKSLSPMLLLLHDDLGDDFVNESIKTMDAYLRGDEKPGSPKIGDVNLDARQHTGANLADITLDRICQGVASNDAPRVKKAISDFMTCLAVINPDNIQHGVTDGFYEDGSFIQHSTVPYTGSYGIVLLGRTAQLTTLLHGTSLESGELLATVNNWIYNSFSPLMYEGYMMEIVKGRGVSRTGSGYTDSAGIIEALVQLSTSMSGQTQQKLQSYIKYLGSIKQLKVDSSKFASANNTVVYNQILNDNTISSENPVTDNQYFAFNLMDKSVLIRPGYAFAISRSSDRISKYEYMSGENLKPWYQGDGAYYLYQDGVDQTKAFGIDYQATVDPNKLPGVTTVNEERKTIPELYGGNFYSHEPEFESGSVAQNTYVYFPLGTNDFSGSAALKKIMVLRVCSLETSSPMLIKINCHRIL